MRLGLPCSGSPSDMLGGSRFVGQSTRNIGVPEFVQIVHSYQDYAKRRRGDL
jgi:hypothetical protein